MDKIMVFGGSVSQHGWLIWKKIMVFGGSVSQRGWLIWIKSWCLVAACLHMGG